MTTRRLFLRSSGLALASLGLAPRLLVRALEAAEAGPGRRLVVVFQRGAMDGLNVVVPFGEKAYRSARPTIAIPEPRRGAKGETAIDLDGFFGLHPALEPLAPLWSEGSLAAVQAVGSPDPTRSHFDAQDFMETGTPGRKSTEDGWLNRALRAAPDPGAATPLRAVAMTPTLPRTLAGAAPAVALASLAQFRLGPAGGGGSAAAGFESLYETAVESALRGAAHDTFEALESLKGLDPRRYRPAAGARYPRGRFGETLQQVAQLFKADVGVQAAFVESGGWDHHAAEGGVSGQLANRLRELASGLYAFHRDMGAAMADVVVVTLTEFGRTVRENGNRGTDHGHASVSLVLGGPVRGGKVHGRWPGLGPGALFEGRDLAVTTDFRDLLGEVLARHLGARDLRAVFPGHANDPARLPGVMRG